MTNKQNKKEKYIPGDLSQVNKEVDFNKQNKKEEWEVKVGMLRQWLNEERISEPSKIITNEDINYWLKIDEIISKCKEETIKEVKGEIEKRKCEEQSWYNIGWNECIDFIIKTLKDKYGKY